MDEPKYQLKQETLPTQFFSVQVYTKQHVSW